MPCSDQDRCEVCVTFLYFADVFLTGACLDESLQDLGSAPEYFALRGEEDRPPLAGLPLLPQPPGGGETLAADPAETGPSEGCTVVLGGPRLVLHIAGLHDLDVGLAVAAVFPHVLHHGLPGPEHLDEKEGGEVKTTEWAEGKSTWF